MSKPCDTLISIEFCGLAHFWTHCFFFFERLTFPACNWTICVWINCSQWWNCAYYHLSCGIQILYSSECITLIEIVLSISDIVLLQLAKHQYCLFMRVVFEGASVWWCPNGFILFLMTSSQGAWETFVSFDKHLFKAFSPFSSLFLFMC